MIQIYDPVGKPVSRATKSQQGLSSLSARKVGFVWNQYQSTTRFWPEMEGMVASFYEPSDIRRVYKENTWSPAPPEKLRELMEESEYLVVGVGA